MYLLNVSGIREILYVLRICLNDFCTFYCLHTYVPVMIIFTRGWAEMCQGRSISPEKDEFKLRNCPTLTRLSIP